MKEDYNKLKKRNKEYDKLYRIKNREKLRLQAKDYYRKNKKQILSKYRDINRKRSKEYYNRYPEKKREAQLKYLYRIDLNDYKKILEIQGDGCAICGSKKNLCIDHDHSLNKDDNGYVRGILCNTCNAALGMFKDNVDMLIMAALYIDKGERK